MILKLTILALLLVLGIVFLGREVMEVGTRRRAGADERTIYRRFRRRTKGVILLVALYLMAAFFDQFFRATQATPRIIILYTGAAFVLLIWLLLLAGRDVRETALMAITERKRLTEDSFLRIDEAVRRRRASRTDAPARPPGVAGDDANQS